MIHNLIRIAVRHENGSILVGSGLGDQVRKLEAQKQVRRQADNARQLVLCREARKDAHGAALRETADDDTLGRNPGINLLLDQTVEVLLADQNSRFVLVLAERLGIAVDCVLGDMLKTWGEFLFIFFF